MATGDTKVGSVVIPPLAGCIFHFELHDWYPIKRNAIADPLLVCDVTHESIKLDAHGFADVLGWNPGPNSRPWRRIGWEKLPAARVRNAYVIWFRHHKIALPTHSLGEIS